MVNSEIIAYIYYCDFLEIVKKKKPSPYRYMNQISECKSLLLRYSPCHIIRNNF